MKLLPLAAALVALPGALSQSPRVFNVSVSFDNTYDNAGGSLLTTACSNGPNGLATQFGNFSALPGFPNIGGAFVVDRFDSPMCGTCWALTVNRTTINVLAVDRTFNGQTFNIAEAAMDLLTNGFARFLGRVNATAVMVGQMDACEAGSRTGAPHV